ncbi:S8 family serine peptidase [Nonomuraea dietziae]|uniref:Subtilisin family serine protease n=2 Tax=Nonomuraea dietziae TaxID=65515 RepID=A0A7W5YAA2_9ACTN|nr:S8 family serine peptidase [Nonomuraea dietziae]MBB3726758.1 subtilisin family serine protease [Nonomuraea dietziae]
MYAAAALATAVTTAAPVVASVIAPAASAPVSDLPARPYLVTAAGRAEARALLADGHLRVRRYYTSALPGFATWLTDHEAAALRADARVRSVEPDREVRALGLPPLGEPSRPSLAGEGVTVYVLDTGVDVTRKQFGDRAWRAFDATGPRGRASDAVADHGQGPDAGHHGQGSATGGDGHRPDTTGGRARGSATGGDGHRPDTTGGRGQGAAAGGHEQGSDVTGGRERVPGIAGSRERACGRHGTRAAALVAGRRYGVAPGARVASVKVLGCDGSGPLSDVVAGLDWVRGHARRPAVAVLAVSAADSPAVEAAARRLRRSGVLVVSSPLAAGTVARHLESHPAPAPSTLASWLKSTTTHDAIRQNPSRTPNLLLHGGGL